jgi:hypothetical protein
MRVFIILGSGMEVPMYNNCMRICKNVNDQDLFFRNMLQDFL